MFAEFMEVCGWELIAAALTAIAGAIGFVIKNLYKKHVDSEEKERIVKAVVRGVEQMYKDLHGDDKLNAALDGAAEWLAEKGIKTSEFELRWLIESAVGEFNEAFTKTATETAE